MGIITSYLGCTPEAAIIEYSLGTLFFFGWFFTMLFLGYYYDKRKEEDTI
jgi:hypothetical protein